MWLWTLGASSQPSGDVERIGQEAEEEGESDEEETNGKPTRGFTLEFDAARKIAQGLGANLNTLGRIVEIKGDSARLLSVAERARYLFADSEARQQQRPQTKGRRGVQGALFADDEVAPGASWSIDGRELAPTQSTLDRVHQGMLLFSGGRTDALKRLLVEEGAGLDGRFWRVAQSLSALYPLGTDEKRWIDGLLARRKSFNL